MTSVYSLTWNSELCLQCLTWNSELCLQFCLQCLTWNSELCLQCVTWNSELCLQCLMWKCVLCKTVNHMKVFAFVNRCIMWNCMLCNTGHWCVTWKSVFCIQVYHVKVYAMETFIRSNYLRSWLANLGAEFAVLQDHNASNIIGLQTTFNNVCFGEKNHLQFNILNYWINTVHDPNICNLSN